MSDRGDIVDVLVHYAMGIDSRDWALFRTCFTDDAHFDYGNLGTWDRPDALTNYMRRSFGTLDAPPFQLRCSDRRR